MNQEVAWLQSHENECRLAYAYEKGASPAVLFCSGFQSSMTGTKAVALEGYCRELGLAFCRFDYRGHGASTGNFEDCTLTHWIEDTSNILDRVLSSHEKIILVGSSMGGWVSLHLALQHPDRIGGILGIAAAPDFFQDLYTTSTTTQREEWRTKGVVRLPTQYDASPYPVSWRLIQDAQEHWGLLDGGKTRPIPVRCPVRLLHGQCDEDVSWKKSLELAERLETDDAIVTLIKSGDHRLSRPQDLERMFAALDELIETPTNPKE